MRSVDDVLLAALEIEVARGRLAGLDVAGPVAVIADEYVLELHPLGFGPNQVHCGSAR